MSRARCAACPIRLAAFMSNPSPWAVDQRTSSAEILSANARDRFADLMVLVATKRNRAAFSELFHYYAPRIKSYAMRLGCDSALAEEVAQETMISVWRKASLFDPSRASVSTWIFRIARNRRIDIFRRTRKSDLDPYETTLLPAALPAPDAEFDVIDREKNVRAALASLSVAQLKTLELAFYCDLSHREIARIVGVPLGTVKSRIRMALRNLRPQLQDQRC